MAMIDARESAAPARRSSVPPARKSRPPMDTCFYSGMASTSRLNSLLVSAMGQPSLDAGEIMRLLKAGADPNAQNSAGVPLREVAKARGETEIVKLFEKALEDMELQVLTAF